MSNVTVSGLTKSFGGRPVLDGVDLLVQDASIMAVLGASGCGKTTLLRIIAGFLEPDAGSVAMQDRCVADNGVFVPPQHRRVGYVPQEGALFPHLDVRGNILFGLPRRLRGRRRLQDMLDLAELPSHVADLHPHQLSGGQQQRVALARALAPEPDVVLLDEPFASLDAALRESAGREVARVLRAAGTTAILVTHDQGEALSLADRVAVMRHGRLAQVAAPAELYRVPVDVDVAAFVGGATILPARLVGDRATCLLGELTVDADGVTDGDAVILVRPEQLVVAGEASTHPLALVTEVSFYGHYASLRLRIGDGNGTTLVARAPADGVPAPGERVPIEVRGRVRAYQGES